MNAALLADPSRLVVMQTSPLTSAADATRPNFILDRLTRGVRDFAPEAGVGTAAAPFSGSLQSYIRQMISQQGEAAANADSLIRASRSSSIRCSSALPTSRTSTSTRKWPI